MFLRLVVLFGFGFLVCLMGLVFAFWVIVGPFLALHKVFLGMFL